MNYKQIYSNIIDRGKGRTLQGYTEIHHIIPKCMGGGNDEANLVELTPEEHYICHLLLVKIYPNNILLIRAAMFMCSCNNTQQRSNKLYGWIKRQYSDFMKGEDNPTKQNGPWNKGITGYKNKVNFSASTRNSMSTRMKNNNPCKGIKPWKHPRATEYTISIWMQSDIIFKIWNDNNKPSYCKLHSLVRGENFNSVSIGPFMNMIKYFRRGWIPIEDEEWIKFKTNKENVC